MGVWQRSGKALGFIPKLLWNTDRNSLLTDIENIVEEADIGITNINNTDIVNNNTTQNVEENNYVNNYLTTRVGDTINNVIVPPFASPNRFSYRRPPNFQSEPPPRNLPTEIDNQTSFQTPLGASINVSSTISDPDLSRLMFNPLSTGKKGIKRNGVNKAILYQYLKAQKLAIKAREKLEKDNEPVPPQHSGFLIATSQLAGLKGQGSILFGLESLSALAQSYRALSTIAYLEPTNEIISEYEIIDIKDKYDELSFKGEAQIVTPKIWDILGYEESDFKDKSLEDIIKEFGEKIYALDNQTLARNQKAKNVNDIKTTNKIGDIEIDNIQQFVTYLISSLFYRNGFHRFPATLPESLLFDSDKYKKADDQPNIFIDDALEYQEYLLTNLDAILGQFPIEFNYEFKENGKSKKQKIKIDNLAETLTELTAILINLQNNSESQLAIGMKNLIETAKGANASIIASDISRANAEYLGFRSKEVKKDVPLTFTPNGEDLAESLKDSTQKIVSFENSDNDTLIDDLKQILIATQIIKSAMVQPFNNKDSFITGDGIKAQKQSSKEKSEQDWQEFIDGMSSTNDVTIRDRSNKST